MNRSWMNADETAACLHITKATLYKLVHEGRVPGHRRLGRWMFRPEEIERLFSHDETAPIAPTPAGAPEPVRSGPVLG
jgi:excisionase family DNA binding protein